MGREQGFNSGGKLLAAWAGAFVCMAPVAFGALEVLSPWRDGIGTFYGGAPGDIFIHIPRACHIS